MNDIIIDAGAAVQSQGINKYTLRQSHSAEVREVYERMLQMVEGSLTTVADNDARSKFIVAAATLSPTKAQVATLAMFKEAFVGVENTIDPERLQFKIDSATDNDICIFRRSANGVVNVIINDDGGFAFSFNAFRNSGQPDIFEYYEAGEDVDCEYLTYKFFSI